MMPRECVFCGIVAGKSPASVVHQDEDVVAFMGIQPLHSPTSSTEPRLASARHSDERAGHRLGAASVIVGPTDVCFSPRAQRTRLERLA